MTEIKRLRRRIDKIDRQLLDILSRRFQTVESLGRLKKKLGLPIVQKKRWGELFADRVKRAEKKKLSQRFVRQLYNLIHKEAIAVQKGLK